MTIKRDFAYVVAFLSVLLLLPAGLTAQPRASERATVTQIVNGTSVTFDFSRPVARGRDHLFGGVVHWGELWTPGANWATTLEVDNDIKLNGHVVSAGKYSVWMRVQPEEWTVFLNGESRLYHDTPVPEEKHVLSFTAKPMEGPHMEALAWYFPSVSPMSAEVRMHWGATYLPLTIETLPFKAATLSSKERTKFVGKYQVFGMDPTTEGPLSLVLEITEDGEGGLAGMWGRAPLELIPTPEGELLLGFLRNGKLFDVAPEMTIRAIEKGDRKGGIDLLWEGWEFAKGDRMP